MTEVEERAAVVEEAKSWLGTPYHQNADVKGAGVDCGMLPLRVFSAVGLIEFRDPRPYPIQWSLHQKAERYLEIVSGYAHEIVGPPLPGDLAMFKMGHTYSHSVIVVSWPNVVIHANGLDCRYDDVEHNTIFMRLVRDAPPRFFSIWPRGETKL